LKRIIIAIDGPAASGKSTTARLVAEQLGYLHVDTGAMYRALTLKVLRENIDVGDVDAVGAVAVRTRIRLQKDNGTLRVMLDGDEVTEDIRTLAVTRHVSLISSYQSVREAMVREQRALGEQSGVVLEGRDIGTVVFPTADLKIYMVARVEERARRRLKELEGQGVRGDLEGIKADIIRRDEYDSGRALSPLRRAGDAVVLDTSELTVDQQVEFIVQKAREMIGRQ
jgi:cytidylate kinase